MTAEFVLLCSNLVAKPGRKYLDNTHCPSVELNISGVTLPTLPNIKVTYRVLQTDLHHTNIFSFPAKNTGGSWIENHRHTQCSSKDQRKNISVLCTVSVHFLLQQSQVPLTQISSKLLSNNIIRRDKKWLIRTTVSMNIFTSRTKSYQWWVRTL